MARTGGRIRNEDARAAALASAAALVEELGYGPVTIERVAAHSGVAKSTIYRWWKSKGVLVMDAYSDLVASRMAVPTTGVFVDDLTAFLRALYRVEAHPARVAALRGLMAQAQLDPDFAAVFAGFVADRRAVLAALFRDGIARGELAADLDVDYAVDLIFGPFWYRLLVGHAPLRPRDVPAQVSRLLAGLAT